VAYYMMGDLERAVEAYRRGVEADSSRVLGYGNLATTQVENGQLAAAESTLARLDARFPGNPRALIYRRDVAYARGDYETSERLARQVRDLAPAPGVMIGAARMLAQTLLLQGRLAEAEREARAALSVAGDRGFATEYLNITVDLTMADLLRDAPAAGLRRLDEALRRYPLNEITPLDRPYGGVAYALAALGQPARARQLVRDWEATGRTAQGEDARWLKLTTAVIDVAEQRYDAALDNIRAFGTRFFCRVCADMMSALAYDGAGRADSALAYWEAYATSPQRMLWWDFGDLARAYKRLGELYEARGDRERAVEWYGKFTELWQGADPDLQPVVGDVRRRMQRLAGERPS
jgi:tetratricopeptide (TPR) repeat protein